MMWSEVEDGRTRRLGNESHRIHWGFHLKMLDAKMLTGHFALLVLFLLAVFLCEKAWFWCDGLMPCVRNRAACCCKRGGTIHGLCRRQTAV